jgi:phenylacetate-CoA ligase
MNFGAKTAKILENIRLKESIYWKRESEKRSLEIFRAAAKAVPAYKDFLKKNKINPEAIETFEDFKKIPAVSKSNYLTQYPLNKLCAAGALKSNLVFTSTSGSTGEPFYFCRSTEIDWQSSVVHEFFYNNSSRDNGNATLVIVGFGMGVWIGGLITYQAFEMLGMREHPISIITPGINKVEIFKSLKKLAPNFKQVIIAGYPPFIKDLIDEAPSHGIDLAALKPRLLFAAEPFSEDFRDLVAKKSGIENVYRDTMNIYGSADIGTMAFETPLSILVRRLAVRDEALFERIFGKLNKVPTLAQYIPSFICFETNENGEVLLTSNNTVPLIRYNIGDHGGTFTYDELTKIFEEHGLNLGKELQKAGLRKFDVELPFVYVYERLDFSTTLYGLQIYPDTIREVLLKLPFNEFLTGKLTLETKFDGSQNQFLEINLELQKGKDTPNEVLRSELLNAIVGNLQKKNSEYNELHKHLRERAIPKLVFWEAENPEYFKPGAKQKWVKK